MLLLCLRLYHIVMSTEQNWYFKKFDFAEYTGDSMGQTTYAWSSNSSFIFTPWDLYSLSKRTNVYVFNSMALSFPSCN